MPSERIAAGDLIADGRIAEHLITCPGCAAALESARRVERLAAHSGRCRRVRRRTSRPARWARCGARGGAAISGSTPVSTSALSRSSSRWARRCGCCSTAVVLAAVSNDAVGLFRSGLSDVRQPSRSSLPLYGAAAAILATALGSWWWAEQEAADVGDLVNLASLNGQAEAFTRQITNFPTHQLSLHFFYAKVAELADAPVLGCRWALALEGSSSFRTPSFPRGACHAEAQLRSYGGATHTSARRELRRCTRWRGGLARACVTP